MGRVRTAAGSLLLFLALLATPVRAEPVTVPFTPALADFMRFRVEYSHADSLLGRPLPEALTRYAVRVSVDSTADGTLIFLVHNESIDLTVDGERGPAPADLGSLMLLSIGSLVARVELTPSGQPIRVTNWGILRETVSERARARAAGNAALLKEAEAYLSGLTDFSAVGLFAQPLALAAVGRSVTFDPPDGTVVTREKLALPSFLPSALSAWAFTLADDPPSPSAVGIAWQGAPEASSLPAILAPIAEQVAALAPTPGVDPASLAAASVRQVFRADYVRADGRLLDLSGTLTVTAGPFARRETISVKTEP